MPSSVVNSKHLAATEYAMRLKGVTHVHSTADAVVHKSATQKLVRATLQQEYAKHREEKERYDQLQQ